MRERVKFHAIDVMKMKMKIIYRLFQLQHMN